MPPKFHDKTVQSNILWLNLNKIIETSFYSQHINEVTPHFTFMRRAQNGDTHAHKQHRLSQNLFPVCSSFVLVIASDMHLEPESEKRAKNVHFLTAKNIHDKTVQSRWDIFFLQSVHKQGNPSFHFHAPGSKRRYPCTQTALAVPKYFPSLLQLCTGYRI